MLKHIFIVVAAVSYHMTSWTLSFELLAIILYTNTSRQGELTLKLTFKIWENKLKINYGY